MPVYLFEKQYLMINRKIVFLPAIAIALSIPSAFAAEKENSASVVRTKNSEPTPPSIQKLYAEKKAKPLGLNLELKLGAATFNDLQTPVADIEVMRIDGTSTEQDVGTHQGISIGGALSYESNFSLATVFGKIDASRASSSGPIGAPPASYIRLSVSGGSLWNVTPYFRILTDIEARRSSYKNTDNGHYIDAILLGGGLEGNYSGFGASIKAGMAPVSQTGYSQSAGSGLTGSLENTETNLSVFDASVSYSPNRETKFFTSINQEQVGIKFSGLSGYRKLGLNVESDNAQNSSKIVQLSTTTINVGARKSF